MNDALGFILSRCRKITNDPTDHFGGEVAKERAGADSITGSSDGGDDAWEELPKALGQLSRDCFWLIDAGIDAEELGDPPPESLDCREDAGCPA